MRSHQNLETIGKRLAHIGTSKRAVDSHYTNLRPKLQGFELAAPGVVRNPTSRPLSPVSESVFLGRVPHLKSWVKTAPAVFPEWLTPASSEEAGVICDQICGKIALLVRDNVRVNSWTQINNKPNL